MGRKMGRREALSHSLIVPQHQAERASGSGQSELIPQKIIKASLAEPSCQCVPRPSPYPYPCSYLFSREVRTTYVCTTYCAVRGIGLSDAYTVTVTGGLWGARHMRDKYRQYQPLPPYTPPAPAPNLLSYPFSLYSSSLHLPPSNDTVSIRQLSNAWLFDNPSGISNTLQHPPTLPNTFQLFYAPSQNIQRL